MTGNSKSSGIISHGVGNYSINLRCSWLLDGRSIGARRVSLSLDSFSTECSWDHVYVYEGDGIYGRQLAAFSGILPPQKPPREIIIDSPTIYVYFYSDTAYNMTGFNISYRFDVGKKVSFFLIGSCCFADLTVARTVAIRMVIAQTLPAIQLLFASAIPDGLG